MEIIVRTGAQKAETPKAGRWIGSIHWRVTVETEDGKTFESLMLFRNEPPADEIKKFFERRREMFQECALAGAR